MNKEFAIIGHPLGHTMSPFIHSRLFELSGINANYSVIDIPTDNLSASISKLKNLSGFNVTIPYKETIIPFLDKLDKSAKTYNAVNCIKSDNTGLTGYNTDSYGFIKSLEMNNIDIKESVLVLGCGGVARTIAKELCDKGCFITFAVRPSSVGKANQLKTWLNSFGGNVKVIDINSITERYDLCVNATPVGMYPNIEAMPIDKTALSKCNALFDTIYNPCDTKLIKTAQEIGIKAIGGMAMLVLQAAKAHEYWYGGTFENQDITKLIYDTNEEMVRIFHEK